MSRLLKGSDPAAVSAGGQAPSAVSGPAQDGASHPM
jgi:hypothetical protein